MKWLLQQQLDMLEFSSRRVMEDKLSVFYLAFIASSVFLIEVRSGVDLDLWFWLWFL